MNLYAYVPREDGTEPMGTANKMIIHDLKTVRGAINRCKRVWTGKEFKLFSYTRFFDNSTFTQLAHFKPTKK